MTPIHSFSAVDFAILEAIAHRLAKDQTEGLNWPGVARLIKKALKVIAEAKGY